MFTSCSFAITAKKPVNTAYPEELITIGDHLRKARLDKGLLQKDVAILLKVDVMTITNWENNRSEPMFGYYPRLVEFIGYIPEILTVNMMLGEKLIGYRKEHQLTQRQLAGNIGIGLNTLRNIENNKGKILKRTKSKISDFLRITLAFKTKGHD